MKELLIKEDKLMKRPFLLALLTLLMLFSSSVACLAASYTFTTLDVPVSDGWGTTPMGINNSGQIVGFCDQQPNNMAGFSYSNGAFTMFNVPGAQETYDYGVSNSGQIVGVYNFNATSYQQGFSISGGIFTDLASTCPSGISNSGNTTGTYMDPSGNNYWFTQIGSILTTFDNSSPSFIDPKGINNLGQVVGMCYGADGSEQGFSRSADGNLSFILFPGTDYTVVNGINDLGQIVGYYVDPLNLDYGYHGFIKTGDTFTTVDVPVENGSWKETRIYGINDSGEIVGGYLDASGVEHGFLGTPTPIPPSAWLFLSGLLGLLGWRRCRRS